MGKHYTRPSYDHPLKTELKKRGYTYDEFADLAGISRDTIVNIVKGRYPRRHSYIIDSIAYGLKISHADAERIVNGV